ncbi:MAG TPA: hypothetical protein VGB04_14360 [Allosphingosinicella sp.]|jgi:hypothetical protein
MSVPQSPGLFWPVGKGGYGLQSAPAMVAIVEALAKRARAQRPGRAGGRTGANSPRAAPLIARARNLIPAPSFCR